MIGFLEESPGTRSMTRLAVLLMCIAVLVLAISAAIAATQKDAATVAAMGSPILGLAGGIWGALKERNKEVDNASG